MRTRRLLLVLLAGTLVLAASRRPGRAAPADDDAPAATQVVVRGKKVFAEALQAAARPAWAGSAPRPVLLVFDVTPHSQRGRTAIEEGLAALERVARTVSSWSVAALGGKASKPVSSPVALGTSLAEVLAQETDVVSTLTALAKTLKSWREKDGVVVYVADWHFEDDVDLEGFIQSLRKKGRTLSVVGTEAAFRRGWNDGLRDTTERFELDVRGTSLKDYWEGVGRDPFGGKDVRAPWHGGDTAYPYAPYRWCNAIWESAFSQSDWEAADLDVEVVPTVEDGREHIERFARLEAIRVELARIDKELARPDLDEVARGALRGRRLALEAEQEALMREIEELQGDPPGPGDPRGGVPDPEELKGRLPDGTVPGDAERPEWIDLDDVIREFPLPSSFGPYGLMRAAGVTDGRYVLFSWNPSGRKTVVYEYSRCNLFPPDLRSRKAILADLRKNPWARSMLAAWWTLVRARVEVLEQLPPLRQNLRSACRMDRTQDVAWRPRSWSSVGEQKLCVRLGTEAAEALDHALGILDEGLAQGGEPKTDVDQRYHAEALLFRHAARVARFEILETVAVAKDVPRSAFRRKGESPGVRDEPWVRRGRDPQKVRTWRNATPRDLDEGTAIVEERKRLLERFRGTPFGEQLAMNTVDTSCPAAWEHTDTVPDTGRSPSESTDLPKPTPKPPSGGSSGGGPTTGGD